MTDMQLVTEFAVPVHDHFGALPITLLVVVFAAVLDQLGPDPFRLSGKIMKFFRMLAGLNVTTTVRSRPYKASAARKATSRSASLSMTASRPFFALSSGTKCFGPIRARSSTKQEEYIVTKWTRSLPSIRRCCLWSSCPCRKRREVFLVVGKARDCPE